MSNEQLCNGGPKDEPCGCRLTKAELKEAGFGIGKKCPDCSHPCGFHPNEAQARTGGGGQGDCKLEAPLQQYQQAPLQQYQHAPPPPPLQGGGQGNKQNSPV